MIKKYSTKWEETFQKVIANPRQFYKLFFYLLALFLSLMIFYPFYFLFLISITPPGEVANISLLPNAIFFENYAVALDQVPVHHFIFNSLIIATIGTVIVLVVASMAGYAFGRIEFKYRTPLLFLFLVITYFPGTTFLIPLFQFFTGNISFIGFGTPDLFNTPWPVVLPLSGLTLPLAIFILTVFYGQIPDGLEEAARVEGCTRFGALFRVIMPLSTPGLLTAGYLTFIAIYNDFFFSFLLTNGLPENWSPLVHGILQFRGLSGEPYHLMAAASIIGLLPVIAIIFIGQEKIISGLTAGGLKE